jgi:hypothetical protein
MYACLFACKAAALFTLHAEDVIFNAHLCMLPLPLRVY